MWIIPFPKGRKALPYFVILFGLVMLFRCVMSVKSIAQDYGTDKIFVSSEDDYSSFIKGKFFIIEDLEPFMVLAKSSNDAEFHCIADFIDAIGNVHYVQYKITSKDERYDEFMKALDGEAIIFGVLTVLLIVAGCLLWIDFKGILSWIFP